MMLIPYVYYPGTAGEAFDFYVKTLGGKIGAFFQYNAGPSGPMSPGPEFGEKAMHACYQGPGITLFATDLEAKEYTKAAGFDIMLSVESPEEAERIWKAFSDGGTITQPLEETFWAHRFGKITDRWGIPWMINAPKAMQPPPQ